MRRFEACVEERRFEISTFYWRLAWLLLPIYFVVGYPPITWAIFGFSMGSVALRYSRHPIHDEHLSQSDEPLRTQATD